MISDESALRCAVQTALCRYDALSEYDPEGAVRFWKQTASANFILFKNPGCEMGTPSNTRNGCLIYWKNRVWLASHGSDAYTPRDAIPTRSYIESLGFTNETQTEATVRVKQVTEGTEEAKATSQNRWQAVTEELFGQVAGSEQCSLQETTLVEIWWDTWQKREGLWRWTRRACMERFEG